MNPASASTPPDDIVRILATCRTVAVVGLSPKPERDSFRVSRYMQSQGWRVIPVNPVVDVFRNSDDVPPVVDEAIGLSLSAVWLQLGISNDAAINRARAAGMLTVQNRCLMVDHARMSG